MVYQINKPVKLYITTQSGVYPRVQGTLTANQYYYYRVRLGYAGYIYVGKTWCFMRNGVPTIELNLGNVLRDYSYRGYKSLEPNLDGQDWKPVFNVDSSTIQSIDTDFYSSSTIGDNSQVGVIRMSIDISATYNFAQVKIVDFGGTDGYYPLITSSWGIKDEPARNTDFTDFQDILRMETDFVSHYPMVTTENYGVMYMFNCSFPYIDNMVGLRLPCIYISNKPNYTAGNTQAEDIYTGIRYYVTGNGGYTFFNATMANVLTSLDPDAYVPDYTVDVINGGTSYTSTSNTISGGTSYTTASNYVFAGDSSTSNTPVYGYDHRYKIWLWNRSTFESNQTEGNIFIGVIDECPADYYLTWITKSCVPVSFGFSGYSKNKQKVNNTFTLSADNFNKVKLQEFTNSWNLRSGIVDETTYNVFADILTSPYVILWERKTDKIYYVTIDTTDWEEHSVKELKKPLTFELNVSESQKYTLVH